MKVFAATKRRLFIALVVAFLAGWAHHRRNSWDKNLSSLEKDLLSSSPSKSSRSHQEHQSWEELPPVVRRYLGQVLGDIDRKGQAAIINEESTRIRSLRIHQQGLFALNNETWLNFTATQTIGAENVGFVWDATMPLFATGLVGFAAPSIRVYDALVNGKAYLVPSLLGIIPFPTGMNDKNTTLQSLHFLGELQRWLTEAALVPSVLFPQAEMVSWEAIPDEPQRAILSVVEPESGIKASAELSFEAIEGVSVISKVICMRPYGQEKEFPLKPWVGYFFNYQREAGVLVPTYMEAGWINAEKGEQLYFKGHITQFNFTFASPLPDVS